MFSILLVTGGKCFMLDTGASFQSTPGHHSDKRFAPEGKKKGWQVTEMWDKHHEIARLLVLGWSGVAIAEKVGCTPVQVSNVKNSPVVKEKMAIMKIARDAGCIDLGKEIAEMAPIALQRVKEILTEGKTLEKEASVALIAKEANNILDREIGKPVQRVDSRNIHGHYTMEDIERIKEKAKALAAKSGQMIEGE